MSTVTELDVYLKVLGLPIAGVRSLSGAFVVDYLAAATTQQRSQGDTIAAGWDTSAQAGSVKLARRLAQALLDNDRELYLLIRAVVLETVGEINSLRQWLAAFKGATAAAASLADLKTRVAALPNLPDRTAVQARAAIKGRLEAGEADV